MSIKEKVEELKRLCKDNLGLNVHVQIYAFDHDNKITEEKIANFTNQMTADFSVPPKFDRGDNYAWVDIKNYKERMTFTLFY